MRGSERPHRGAAPRRQRPHASGAEAGRPLWASGDRDGVHSDELEGRIQRGSPGPGQGKLQEPHRAEAHRLRASPGGGRRVGRCAHAGHPADRFVAAERIPQRAQARRRRDHGRARSDLRLECRAQRRSRGRERQVVPADVPLSRRTERPVIPARFVWIGGAAALAVALAISGAAHHGAPTPSAADTSIVSRSIAFFEERLGRDPGNFMVGGQLVGRYLMRFQLAAHLEDVKRAEVVARSVMPLVSDTAGAHARLGGSYLAPPQVPGADRATRRAVAWNSNNQEALGLLFDAAIATGRYAVAESTLNRLTPGRLPYQLRLAHFLTAQGRMDGAYYALERACRQLERAQVWPQAVAWCVTGLAKVQHAREGEAPAGALFRRALPIQPGYPAGLEGLADPVYAPRDRRGGRGPPAPPGPPGPSRPSPPPRP